MAKCRIIQFSCSSSNPAPPPCSSSSRRKYRLSLYTVTKCRKPLGTRGEVAVAACGNQPPVAKILGRPRLSSPSWRDSIFTKFSETYLSPHRVISMSLRRFSFYQCHLSPKVLHDNYVKGLQQYSAQTLDKHSIAYGNQIIK